MIHWLGVTGVLSHRFYNSLSTAGDPKEPFFSWDRDRMGSYSLAASDLSDHLRWVGLAVPVVWIGEWGAGQIGGEELRADLVIVLEAALLDGAINKMVRGGALWARPLLFSARAPESERKSAQARSSFYSGHTSTSFAIAAAAVQIQSRRENPTVGALPLGVALFGTAATIGALRVEGGKHYPTDVVAGAAIGTLIGWGVAQLHQVPRKGELPTGFARLIRTKQLKVIPYPTGLILAWRIGGPARHDLKY